MFPHNSVVVYGTSEYNLKTKYYSQFLGISKMHVRFIGNKFPLTNTVFNNIGAFLVANRPIHIHPGTSTQVLLQDRLSSAPLILSFKESNLNVPFCLTVINLKHISLF